MGCGHGEFTDAADTGHISMDHHDQYEYADEPGDLRPGAFIFEDHHRQQCHRDDPQGARQLYRDGYLQGLVAVPGGGAYHRAGVVDGDGAPPAKLLLGKMQQAPQDRKEKKSYRIQDKNNADGNRDLLLPRLDNRRNSGDSASSTDGRTRGYQVRHFFIHFQEAAKKNAHRQSCGYDGRSK